MQTAIPTNEEITREYRGLVSAVSHRMIQNPEMAKDGSERYPHNYKLFNLCRMKTVGVEKWAEEEAKLIRQRYYLGKFIPGSGPILKCQ
ncbi:hypothetical protein ACFLR7_02805 [Acidobacteriota bacterium]